MIMMRGFIVVISMVGIFCASLSMAQEAEASEETGEEEVLAKRLLLEAKWKSEGQEYANDEIRRLA